MAGSGKTSYIHTDLARYNLCRKGGYSGYIIYLLDGFLERAHALAHLLINLGNLIIEKI